MTRATASAPTIVTPPPTLIWSNRETFKRQVIDLLEAGAREIVIDCSQTGYIDASGLGILVSLSKRIRQAGGTLALANLNEDLVMLFELTKLASLFTVIELPARVH